MTLLSSQQVEHCHQFLQHINSQDLNNQSTTQDPNEDGSIPFLVAVVSQGPNNTLTTTVYQKPTPTDQYLHWGSNTIYNTLPHGVRIVCISQPAFQHEESHIRQALLKCHFPSWALNNLNTNFHHRLHTDNTQQTTHHNTTVMVPQ